ncbi:hypothetical protein PENARI_c002G03448 [Penicillium arizonense]|uniref:Uncharacterized protein n=1 Tax=Penicillium arizonense TaxID=1835702 RepID=A0A1F5LVT5_PENAI|nr:hypothetical protein PENARI_c002G03448 [Penicillium arizonense]OGE57270.1 hypothetical protein PENARI_c002G03448 [Penicillium arizonense]
MACDMQSPDVDPAETMRLAMERFRTKMESSNRRFLQDRIDEIEALGISTEEEKLSKMSLYWPDLGAKGKERWGDFAPLGPVRQSREARNATRLEDVNSIYCENMDGIIPPTLVNDEWRQMFLEVVERVCNEAAAQDEVDENFRIPICHELGHFIKYANGVKDPDFRGSDRPAVVAQAAPDISASLKILEHYLQDYILDEDFIQGIVDNDLEVKVGFETGLGSRREHKEWYSAYLYCRSDDDSATTLCQYAPFYTLSQPSSYSFPPYHKKIVHLIRDD